jgi:hypothetical protein
MIPRNLSRVYWQDQQGNYLRLGGRYRTARVAHSDVTAQPTNQETEIEERQQQDEHMLTLSGFRADAAGFAERPVPASARSCRSAQPRVASQSETAPRNVSAGSARLATSRLSVGKKMGFFSNALFLENSGQRVKQCYKYDY